MLSKKMLEFLFCYKSRFWAKTLDLCDVKFLPEFYSKLLVMLLYICMFVSVCPSLLCHVGACVCVCACACVCVCVCVCACVHVCICVCACVCLCLCVCFISNQSISKNHVICIKHSESLMPFWLKETAMCIWY